MPFGLCNALATFQRLMQKALRGLKWKTCLVYLDDIIVFGKTEEEHLERLEVVLQRLQSVGLKIKSKCQLMRQSVRYLGHIVTQHGVGTDPKKTAAVQEWPTPRRVFLKWGGAYPNNPTTYLLTLRCSVNRTKNPGTLKFFSKYV
ncbi:Retrovirus-related Pol polyprotein from transposon 17.6 [Trichinella sp. T9]|nr:Retrovirus-related Pol polyprotein from transposon 17.6 [Trichinella sp. T9]